MQTASIMHAVSQAKGKVSKNFDEFTGAADSSKAMAKGAKEPKARPSMIKEERKLDIVVKY